MTRSADCSVCCPVGYLAAAAARTVTPRVGHVWACERRHFYWSLPCRAAHDYVIQGHFSWFLVFLARSANLPTGLYILLALISFFF